MSGAINWERVARAVGHDSQMRILDLLRRADSPVSPKEGAAAMDLGLSSASYHFKHLHELGLIELHHTIPRRGAVEHYYVLTSD